MEPSPEVEVKHLNQSNWENVEKDYRTENNRVHVRIDAYAPNPCHTGPQLVKKAYNMEEKTLRLEFDTEDTCGRREAAPSVIQEIPPKVVVIGLRPEILDSVEIRGSGVERAVVDVEA